MTATGQHWINGNQWIGRKIGSGNHSFPHEIPSGKRLHNYGKIHHFLMGKSTISMAIFNSYVKLPEGIGFSCNISLKPIQWLEDNPVDFSAISAWVKIKPPNRQGNRSLDGPTFVLVSLSTHFFSPLWRGSFTKTKRTVFVSVGDCRSWLPAWNALSWRKELDTAFPDLKWLSDEDRV